MSEMPTEEEMRAYLESLPGKRGKDIPAQDFDRIHAAASGVTKQIWGRNPTPHQLQWLYDNGHHDPSAVQSAFSGLPHPHAPSVTVGEYEKYSQAHDLFKKAQG